MARSSSMLSVAQIFSVSQLGGSTTQPGAKWSASQSAVA